MLALRPNCELYDVDLPLPGAGLVNDPPDSRRRNLRYSMGQVRELVGKLRDVPPQER